MTDIAHQIICIAVYDQKCMASTAMDCPPHITVDWFHTILNYTMVTLNSMMVITLMKVVNSTNSGSTSDISRDEKGDTKVNNHHRRKQFDFDGVPSYFATYLCFAFGKFVD